MENDCRQWKLTTVNPQEKKPGDQVWDLLRVQLVIYLEWIPLMWMMPLYLHVDRKLDHDHAMCFSEQQSGSPRTD